MKLSHFNFNLPEELLAEFPTENRDESRLMVVNRKTGTNILKISSCFNLFMRVLVYAFIL